MDNYANLTRQLTNFVLDFKQQVLTDELIHAFKRALMDYLAATITGSHQPVTQKVLDYLSKIDNRAISSVVGHRLRLSPLNAAFVNGTSAHNLDFDDGHTHGSIHMGGVVFPAVIAVAEHVNSSTEDVIRAGIVGYEIGARLAAALHPNVWQRGYHNTPVIGIFGAVAAVAILLDCDEEEMLDAFGHAGSFAGGLFEFLGEGADTKRFHPGKAARDAILAVELAKRKISGPKHVLEGKHGFIKAFADGKINLERLFDGLKSRYEIQNIYFKPYPCCRHLHGPIDAVKTLRKKANIQLQDIQSITVGTYKVASKHNHYQTESLLDAQMSIPCAVALALVYGDVNMNTFSEEKRSDDRVQTLLRKVQVEVDDVCEREYPKHRPAVVTITMNNGEKMVERVTVPKGEPTLPLTDIELEEKLLNNANAVLKDECLRQMIDVVWSFERRKGIADLTDLLS